MERITYKKIKTWINSWNENHEDIQFEIMAYSGYYHLCDKKTGNNKIIEKTPGRLWESFCIWKDGYHTGRGAT